MARIVPTKKKYGPLEVVEILSDPAAPYIVLLHGYGADCNDLVSLHQAIPLGQKVNWIFPNGHQKVELGPHMEGRAWFPISVAALQQTQTTGTPLDLSNIVPPGLGKARQYLLEMLRELNVPISRVVLGGFSQGAMLACEVTLKLAEIPAGLAILSGTPVNFVEWRKLAPEKKGFRFFQSHGQYDPVLSFEMAKDLNKMLVEAGWQGQLLGFQGQHEIPFEIVSQLGHYIRGQLGLISSK